MLKEVFSLPNTLECACLDFRLTESSSKHLYGGVNLRFPGYGGGCANTVLLATWP